MSQQIVTGIKGDITEGGVELGLVEVASIGINGSNRFWVYGGDNTWTQSNYVAVLVMKGFMVPRVCFGTGVQGLGKWRSPDELERGPGILARGWKKTFQAHRCESNWRSWMSKEITADIITGWVQILVLRGRRKPRYFFNHIYDFPITIHVSVTRVNNGSSDQDIVQVSNEQVYGMPAEELLAEGLIRFLAFNDQFCPRKGSPTVELAQMIQDNALLQDKFRRGTVDERMVRTAADVGSE
ncbi:hypothetical protein BS47DRAFT_1366282 [Hydnum rufescens UP504]|uniref:Uncharacterized protein n=1 Tax=Hydnum rufescens UP504 TaxID=1448309 RepID=A0A9P6DRV1_9AGAM|nr:hypothetical protein BS47DRAFT_1366282 [Hydnum rufescens UP504]